MYFSKSTNSLEKVFTSRIKKELKQSFRLKGVIISKIQVEMFEENVTISVYMEEGNAL